MLSTIKFLLFMSIAAIGCQDSGEFRALKKASEVTLHKLGSQSSETNQKVRIIADRAVESSVLLDGADKKNLIKAIMDISNYQPVSRRCMMSPAYALETDGKVIALFDPQFCPRIQYMGGDREVEYDIKTENNILAVLEQIYADR